MKDLINYIKENIEIDEAFRINKDTKLDKRYPAFSTEVPPELERSDYIQIMTNGKTWKDTGPDIYVKISDIKDKSKTGILNMAYALMKETYPSGTSAEICVWNKDQSNWNSFAMASRNAAKQMWEPKWSLGKFE